MCEEIWKDIPDYPNYQVSNYGNVRNLHFFSHRKTKRDYGVRNLTLLKHNAGYYTVHLHKDGKMRTFLVHRLVAMCFIPNPENKPEIDHINTNRADNRVENLRWVTPQENLDNPISHKRMWEGYRKKVPGMFVGGKSPLSKRVVQLDLYGRVIKVWDSVSDACREMKGIMPSGVSQACKGIIRKHGGYKWAYCEQEIERNKEYL